MDADCPKCGYPMGAECDRCATEAHRYRLHGIAVLGGVRPFEEFTVEGFKSTEKQAPALAACQAFNWKKENLYLAGPVGSGKSHLAAIAARRYLDKVSILTITPSMASRMMRASRDEAQTLKTIAGRDILVLDDLGAEKDTEFMVGLLLDIVGHRYLNHKGGLIVTSNLTFNELSSKMGDDRTVSRLGQMCKFFDLSGEPDHRLSERRK